MPGKIPVSVIITTRNEERRIGKCLAALGDFDEIVVADSGSTDRTKEIAAEYGATAVNFTWNGAYPKKRQWCLDNLSLKHNWVFFVDADEIITPELVQEIAALDFRAAGYFVRGRYLFSGKTLRHGLSNNKLVLLDRRKVEFPVINDIGLPGMGEMEGHYQPVLKKEYQKERIGQLKNAMLHDAYDDSAQWQARHERYAAWERGMNERRAWPGDPKVLRALLKKIFRALPLRPVIAFLHCYILKLGFMDGAAGFRFAASRYFYYRLISDASKGPA
ncbi:MAG: glycosyltransferase family 2 protein [Alphaproteobacteria bacterium]|nr:glycosyltransferase family 2 protein [Alphaproteobacteria bacterium]